jgi:DNA topoisomerase-1
MKLDFLSKDSIRYIKKVELDSIVFNNIKEFMQNKSNKDDIFDEIKPDDLNRYLQEFMKDLTSKVFRTYNASNLFQKELTQISKKFDALSSSDEIDHINIILNEFNKANAKVAILCNHQKNVSKTFNSQIDKIKNRIRDLKKQKNKLEKEKLLKKEKEQNTNSIRSRIKKIDEKIKLIKLKKELKVEMKSVSLGTSKINYIDPRITIAFIKRHKIDINKIFTKILQQKFEWAFEVDQDYRF